LELRGAGPVDSPKELSSWDRLSAVSDLGRDDRFGIPKVKVYSCFKVPVVRGGDFNVYWRQRVGEEGTQGSQKGIDQIWARGEA
jgi:hypothetical protein